VPSGGPEPAGLAPDPAASPDVARGSTPAMDFRAPMPVPGEPAAIAIALPPASGAARITNDPLNPGVPLSVVSTATGSVNTSAVAAVSSSDGHVYLLDLGRFTPVNDASPVSTATRTAVTQAGLALPAGALAAGFTTEIGLSNDFPVPLPAGSAPAVVSDARLPAFFQVTPGFTGSDDWSIAWQGTLPRLAGRAGVVLLAADGAAYAAVQTPSGGAASTAAGWVLGAEVSAPALGVHAGDIVELACSSPAGGASGATVETTVAQVLTEADAAALRLPVAFPGGALKLASGAAIACPAAPGAQTALVALTVRAAALLLTRGPAGSGARSEYIGRPAIGVPFAHQWQPEGGLSGEALVVARKARRLFYPADAGCAGKDAAGNAIPVAGCYALLPWLVDPLAPGPVIAFKVALLETDATRGPPDVSRLARDAQITFTTQSGLSSAFRRPRTGGVLPHGLTVFDRSKFEGHKNDPIRVYATYADDTVISFSPAETASGVRTIR
jgi:hypothetical protein